MTRTQLLNSKPYYNSSYSRKRRRRFVAFLAVAVFACFMGPAIAEVARGNSGDLLGVIAGALGGIGLTYFFRA